MRHVPTAWNLLFNVAELERGETVLIMGAGGNLGSIGIQIAKNVIGAKVIAAAGSDERVRRGLDLGADHGVNYNTHDIQAEVMRFTGGKGVDVLYDNVANPKVLPKAFHAIGFGGRLVTAGAHAGPNVIDRLRAPLPQADHHQGTAGLSPARRAQMLRRRGGAQGHRPDRAHPAALAGGRGAPPDRIRANRRARSCSIRRWDRRAVDLLPRGVRQASSSALQSSVARAGPLPIFRPLPSSSMT